MSTRLKRTVGDLKMLVIIVLAIVLAAGVAAIAVCYSRRERKSSVDLEGDWWTDFETQFRAYAARQSAHHRRLEN